MPLEDIRAERKKKSEQRDGLEIQDGIFRRMGAGEKIRLASRFFDFAQRLGGIKAAHGAGKTTQKDSRHSLRS